MEISICNNKYTYIWNQHIPLNAWYGCDDISWWFCTAHASDNDGMLELYRFNGERWTKRREISATTQAIHRWASTHGLWYSKCYWFKAEDARKKAIAKQEAHDKELMLMMNHKRKHKKGSSGFSLSAENSYANRTFTDYECCKKPLNDFSKTKYI